jgi:hypothetical protein
VVSKNKSLKMIGHHISQFFENQYFLQNFDEGCQVKINRGGLR